jgi:hypothetical protein
MMEIREVQLRAGGAWNAAAKTVIQSRAAASAGSLV